MQNLETAELQRLVDQSISWSTENVYIWLNIKVIFQAKMSIM